MKNTKLVLLTLFVLAGLSAFAQRKADTVVPFSQNIDNILLAPLTGHIIVKEKDAISSYNPESKKVDWTLTKEEIGKMSAVATAQKTLDALSSPDLMKMFESNDQVEFIPESPFVRATIGDKDVIVNSVDGKLVFNSGTKTYRIVRSQFILQEKSFLFITTDGKKFCCVLYDLESGSEKWTSELATVEGFMKQLGGILSLKGGEAAKDKLEVTEQYIYTSINGKLYKLDKADGKIFWKSDFLLTDFYLTQTGKDIIVIANAGGLLSSKQSMNILNAESGKPIWKDDVKTKYLSYIEDWSDRILVAHNSGFNFYSYADGSKIWKKDAKGDDIKKVISVGEDYLYIADTEMNLIDKNGQNKWKKFIEISDDSKDLVYFMDKVDNNRVFYLTATYGNMVDYASGKKIWKGNIEFDKDRPLLYGFDEQAKTFMVYNNKRIYRFDPNATDKPEALTKLKEIKDDKGMAGIELFDWGVCLVGQSDVIGVGFDGSVKYHNTYKEAGGGKRKLMKIGGGIGAGLLATTSSVSSGLANAGVVVAHRDASGNLVETRGSLLDTKSKAKAENVSDITGFGSSAISATMLSRVKERYNAMKHNSNYAFLLAKGENGESTQLVKVRKADGTEVDKIAIDNNKPIYEVDPVTDDVYYVYKNELRIFSKN